MREESRNTLFVLVAALIVAEGVQETPCLSYAPYYCACSLDGIAEVRQLKMCHYEDIAKPGCYPCPEKLQEHVNCDSCDGDTCPICSLHSFGAGISSNKSHEKQLVILKFDRDYVILYGIPPQNNTRDNSYQLLKGAGYHILDDMSGIRNQTSISNNTFVRLQDSQNKTQNKLNVPEYTPIIALDFKNELQRDNVSYSAKQKILQAFKKFQKLQPVGDEELKGKSVNVMEETQKFYVPVSALPVKIKDYSTKTDSNYLESDIRKLKYGNRWMNTEKNRNMHYLPSDKTRIFFMNGEEGILNDYLKNNLLLRLHTSGNEFKLKTPSGDKCYFRRVLNDSTVTSSSYEIFKFQCSITSYSNNISMREYTQEIHIIENETQKCITEYLIKEIDTEKEHEFIKSNCNVSLPLLNLFKVIQVAADKKGQLHNMRVVKRYKINRINFTDKIKLKIALTNLTLEQLNNPNKSTAYNTNIHSSVRGKLKVKINLYRKRFSNKNIVDDADGNMSAFPEFPKNKNASELKIQNYAQYLKYIFPKDGSNVNLIYKYSPGPKHQMYINDIVNNIFNLLTDVGDRHTFSDRHKDHGTFVNMPLEQKRNDSNVIELPPENNWMRTTRILIKLNEDELKPKYLMSMEKTNKLKDMQSSFNIKNETNSRIGNFLDKTDRKEEKRFSNDEQFRRSNFFENWSKGINKLPMFDDETENHKLVQKWPTEAYDSTAKSTYRKLLNRNGPNFLLSNFKNYLIPKNWTVEAPIKDNLNFFEPVTRNHDFFDDWMKLWFNSDEPIFSSYETKNRNRFEKEAKQEQKEFNFPDDKTTNNLEDFNGIYKLSFDKATEDKKENLEAKLYNKQRELDDGIERKKSFQNSIDKTKQQSKNHRKHFGIFMNNLPDILELTDFPKTEQNSTLKRVYRDISNIPLWTPSKDSDEVVLTHHSILKLLSLNPDPVKRKSGNFSDVLWFRYRKDTLIPKVNVTLQHKSLKKSDIYKMLNASISSLKKLNVYSSKCETCSVIYKIMLDEGFKNGNNLSKNDNSSVMVLLDKPQFVTHTHKSKLKVHEKNKSKKQSNHVDSVTIEMSIDLLFLSRDDYEKLRRKSAPKTSLLFNTPWKDVKKKFAFRIPDSIIARSKILDLIRSLKHKNLKPLFKELVHQGQFIEEIQNILFDILSRMHEHKTNVSKGNLNPTGKDSIVMPKSVPNGTGDVKTSFKVNKEKGWLGISSTEEKSSTRSTEKLKPEKAVLDQQDQKQNGKTLRDGNQSFPDLKRTDKNDNRTFQSSGDVRAEIRLKSAVLSNTSSGDLRDLKEIKHTTKEIEVSKNDGSTLNPTTQSGIEHNKSNEKPYDVITKEKVINSSLNAQNMHLNESKKQSIWKKVVKTDKEQSFQQANKDLEKDKLVNEIFSIDEEFHKSDQFRNANVISETDGERNAENTIDNKAFNEDKEVSKNDKPEEFKDSLNKTNASITPKLKQSDNVRYDKEKYENKENLQTYNETADRQMSLLKNENLELKELENTVLSKNASVEKMEKFETNTQHAIKTPENENEKLSAKMHQKQLLSIEYKEINETQDRLQLKDMHNETMSQLKNELKILHYDTNSSNGIERIRRSIYRFDNISDSEAFVTSFQLTENETLHNRQKRHYGKISTGIPQNHWCPIRIIRRNGNLDCRIWTFMKNCRLTCHPGYTYNGQSNVASVCRRRGGKWTPDLNEPCMCSRGSDKGPGGGGWKGPGGAGWKGPGGGGFKGPGGYPFGPENRPGDKDYDGGRGDMPMPGGDYGDDEGEERPIPPGVEGRGKRPGGGSENRMPGDEYDDEGSEGEDMMQPGGLGDGSIEGAPMPRNEGRGSFPSKNSPGGPSPVSNDQLDEDDDYYDQDYPNDDA